MFSRNELIQQFLSQYIKEYDYYDAASRIAAQQIDTKLQASGIRAIVTSRAKNPKRLEEKISKRIKQGRKYESIDDIYKDIVDLAGIRIALYFNGEREEVEKLINEVYFVTEPAKVFTGTTDPSYDKRFSGYWASHYRVNLRKESLTDVQQRYIKARIEIQVASVLMHAWSEVEHDLVYKPMQGQLSLEELAILDELNGLVLCGEIALDRLQKSIETRVSLQTQIFNNHYELAAFLFQYAKKTFKKDDDSLIIGEVEILFRFLKTINKLLLSEIEPYLQLLHPETDRRSITQQIIDQIISGNIDLYNLYRDISDSSQNLNKKLQIAMGKFMSQWIKLERFIYRLADLRGFDRNKRYFSIGLLKNINVFNNDTIQKLQSLRGIRNYLVHGIEIPDAEQLDYYSKEIESILIDQKNNESEDVQLALSD